MMFKIAYYLGCYEALLKLAATQLMPALTPAQQAQMQQLTHFGGAGRATAQQRGLQRFLGSPLAQEGPGASAVAARSQQLGHGLAQNPSIPKLPVWADPRTGQRGYGGQNVPMATEGTQVPTSPSRPVSATGKTQNLRPGEMEAILRSEQGTKAIPHETMQQLVRGKKPSARSAGSLAESLLKLRRLVHA